MKLRNLAGALLLAASFPACWAKRADVVIVAPSVVSGPELGDSLPGRYLDRLAASALASGDLLNLIRDSAAILPAEQIAAAASEGPIDFSDEWSSSFPDWNPPAEAFCPWAPNPGGPLTFPRWAASLPPDFEEALPDQPCSSLEGAWFWQDAWFWKGAWFGSTALPSWRNSEVLLFPATYETKEERT